MAEVDPQRIRQIKIKTGVVKRLAKEKSAYQQECVKEEQKVEKMKTDGKDSHDIKKQQEVLEESRAMIPDCQRRLAVAWDDLSRLLETEGDLKEAVEYAAAEQILEESKEAANR